MTVEDMKQDATVTINWFRVNFPTIVTVVGAIIVVAMQWSAVNSRLDGLDTDRQERSRIADQNYAVFNSRFDALQNIPYRVGQAEASINETRQRLDQLQQTLLSQIELVRKDLARLTTQFEVMNTRVGILTGDLDERGKSIGKTRYKPDQ